MPPPIHPWGKQGLQTQLKIILLVNFKIINFHGVTFFYFFYIFLQKSCDGPNRTIKSPSKKGHCYCLGSWITMNI